MNVYEVIEVDNPPGTITIWDGKTKDPDHPTMRGGTMQFYFDLNGHLLFNVGDKVELVVRKLSSRGTTE